MAARCDTCRDPIGDSEAIVVSGVRSGNRHLVHRPTTPDKAMCFRWGVNGRGQQSISHLATIDTADAIELWHVRLALEMGLDQRAATAVGLSWEAVKAARNDARRSRGGRRNG